MTIEAKVKEVTVETIANTKVDGIFSGYFLAENLGNI